MTPDTGRRLLLTSFFVSLVIVSYQEVHDAHVIPRPKRYFSAGIVYGILGIIAPIISFQIAGVFGIGMLLALIWMHYDKGTTFIDGDTDSENGPTKEPPKAIEY